MGFVSVTFHSILCRYNIVHCSFFIFLFYYCYFTNNYLVVVLADRDLWINMINEMK